MSFTTADLIASIKRRAMVPTNQSTFEEDDILALADEELRLGLVPLIMSTREEFYVTYKDYSSGSTSYDLPPRAIGMKLRDLVLVDSGDDEHSVPQINPEQAEFLGSSAQNPKFYLRGNKFIFTDAPTDDPRAYYYLRPNKLVVTTDAAQITSINSGSNQVDVSSLPSTIVNGSVVDFIKSKPGFDLLALDQTITGVASTTLTFASLPSGLIVGDWIALAEESPIVQVPFDLIPVLAQRVAVQILESTGDLEHLQAAAGKLGKMEKAAFGLIEPRVDGAHKKIINRHTILRRSFNGQRNGRS